jgi:signal transduction histidine kinase
VCQGLIERYGGQINAANLPQGGAIFRVWLPCEPLLDGEPPLDTPL